MDIYGRLLSYPIVWSQEGTKVDFVAGFPFGTNSPQLEAIAAEVATRIELHRPKFVFYMGGYAGSDGSYEADDMQALVEQHLIRKEYPLDTLEVLTERQSLDTHQQVVYMDQEIQRLIREKRTSKARMIGLHIVAEELHYRRAIRHCERIIFCANLSGTKSRADRWGNSKKILRTRKGFARRELFWATPIYEAGLAPLASAVFSRPKSGRAG